VISAPVLLESCVDSVASARTAEKGGAGRVELCADLAQGGTTPSAGTIARCVEALGIPVIVMIRPRGGDFLYDAEELEVMRQDVRMARSLDAGGIACGALRADGTIDVDAMRLLLEEAGPLSVTFHRAFDATSDFARSLDALIALGVQRVLTSGGAAAASDAMPMIREFVARSEGSIAIMAGGGVRAHNVRTLVEQTGVREVHARIVERVESGMRFRAVSLGIAREFVPDAYATDATSLEGVRAVIAALQSPGK
jgi:copper homeostasis protein